MGEIPDSVLVAIGKHVVHRLAVGMVDITGDDFGTIFASSIGGQHRTSPLGIADVECDGCAWSAKTVKANRPFDRQHVRLISGRNSPDYSLGIENPHADIQATGRAVLSIWNARVNEVLDEFDELRITVLIRNTSAREFVLFEEEAQIFVPDNYVWTYSKHRNLEGREKLTGAHRFTWQFHGGQFTVLRDVPPAARQFAITPDVPIVELAEILTHVKFREDWIDIVL